jgi:mRNA-decapping enzyme subunit 2
MNQELTKVLLVQGFRNQWGFPKGKINEVEDPVDCAVREVTNCVERVIIGFIIVM